jgi:hypothetical protein
VTTYEGRPAIRICDNCHDPTNGTHNPGRAGCFIIFEEEVPAFFLDRQQRVPGCCVHGLEYYSWPGVVRVEVPECGRVERCIRRGCGRPMPPNVPGVYCDDCHDKYAVEAVLGHARHTVNGSILSQWPDALLREWVAWNCFRHIQGGTGALGLPNVEYDRNEIRWGWRRFPRVSDEEATAAEEAGRPLPLPPVQWHRLKIARIVEVIRDIYKAPAPREQQSRLFDFYDLEQEDYEPEAEVQT